MSAYEPLIRVFVELHPDEAARAFETLDLAESVRLLRRLPARATGPLWDRLSPPVASSILEQLDPEQRRERLAAMTPRRASTILQQLDEAHREDVLASLPTQLASQLREVVRYPPETAGGMMEPRVTVLTLDLTVQEAVSRLRKAPRETLYYLYVTDREGKLVGVLNMRDLLLAAPRDPIEPLVRHPVLSVPATMDREEVVTLMRERRFLALPVVDADGKLLGVVKHDEALHAGQLEAFEDLQKMVGAGGDERALSPVPSVVRKRLPWLYVNLLTAFVAAAVVGLFEGIIQQVTALAVLLPVVAGQGGNTGAQALAVVMRGLALREIIPGTARRVILKEALAGLVNGGAVSAVTAGSVLAWSGSTGLAMVIGLAMIVNMVAAGASGAAIPLLLRALGRDPAQSSAIFLTTVTDVVGFASFLGLAVVFSSLLIIG